jgi:hypothetical protein
MTVTISISQRYGPVLGPTSELRMMVFDGQSREMFHQNRDMSLGCAGCGAR